MQSAPRTPERDQLLQAVDGIAEVIRADAAASEELRHLPESSVEALEHAGIFRMVLPRELGGHEADPVTQHEVIDRLAYHDASAGWSPTGANQLPIAPLCDIVNLLRRNKGRLNFLCAEAAVHHSPGEGIDPRLGTTGRELDASRASPKHFAESSDGILQEVPEKRPYCVREEP